MKKARFVVLGLCFCGAFFILGGCAQTNNPKSIEVFNAKTEFQIGEKFSLSDNMVVDLVFENEERMSLETPVNYNFFHDPINKTYTGVNYVIDYSNFDSTKGGSYPIFVEYLDKKANQTEILIFYPVNVNWQRNSWVKEPALNNWTYGETPTFAELPVAEYNNESLEYSYRSKDVGEFQTLSTENICQELSKLGAGEYDLKVLFKKSSVYDALEKTLNFTVERSNLPENEEALLETLAPKTYTGDIVLPTGYNQELFLIDDTVKSQFVNAGDYRVPFKVNPNYKWKDTDDSTKYFDFEILPAQNSWIKSELEIFKVQETFGWVKGEFSLGKVIKKPDALFGEVVYAFKEKGQSDNEYSDIALVDLRLLDAGEYVLKAYVKSSNNYSDIAPILLEFKVFEE